MDGATISAAERAALFEGDERRIFDLIRRRGAA